MTTALPSPHIFRKWGAISAVAGALERKVWMKMHKGRMTLYPNLYVTLVGPPGVGKTVAISEIQALWRKLPDHHVAPSSLTKAALIDTLNEAHRRIMRPHDTPNFLEFNSLLIPSNELGVLIPQYENEFMNVLTDIYDCKLYHERRRGGDLNIEIKSPQINFLAGTTPSYLNGVMPEGAWDQGFIARMFLIYSGENTTRSLFSSGEDNEPTDEELQALGRDLKDISELYGKMKFSEGAVAMAEHWHLLNGPPIPTHPKLQHYNSRRTNQHIIKLAMVASASRSTDLIIEPEDFQTALNWLLEAEACMPDIFKSMASGGDSKAMELAWYQVMAYQTKHKCPMPDAILVTILGEMIPAHSVARVIELMVRSNMLKMEGTPGGPAYKILPRAPT